MTDPFSMTDADLLKRYRRALACIMGKVAEINAYRVASWALFGDNVSISTSFEPPPIPDRRHDWSATDESTYEPGAPVGEGETEVEAILDLIDKMEVAKK